MELLQSFNAWLHSQRSKFKRDITVKDQVSEHLRSFYDSLAWKASSVDLHVSNDWSLDTRHSIRLCDSYLLQLSLWLDTLVDTVPGMRTRQPLWPVGRRVVWAALKTWKEGEWACYDCTLKTSRIHSIHTRPWPSLESAVPHNTVLCTVHRYRNKKWGTHLNKLKAWSTSA